MKKQRAIEHLDLDLRLTQRTVTAFTKALEAFMRNAPFVQTNPMIIENTLRINSSDLVTFVGYLNPNDLTEFEFNHFSHQYKKQLEGLQRVGFSEDNAHHYTWCLAALTQLAPGRFLTARDPEEKPAPLLPLEPEKDTP